MSLFDDLVAAMSGAPGSASLSPAQQTAMGVNTTGTSLALAGDLLNAGGTLMAGREAQLAARFTAAQLRQNAGQAQASSQRQAYEVDRQSQLIASRALAVAAASGGGASDPTVVNILARTAQEGSYRRAVALYGGDERARSMNLAADAKEMEGNNAEIGSWLSAGAKTVSAGANLMRGRAQGASMYQRFAGGGPKLDSPLSDEGDL